MLVLLPVGVRKVRATACAWRGRKQNGLTYGGTVRRNANLMVATLATLAHAVVARWEYGCIGMRRHHRDGNIPCAVYPHDVLMPTAVDIQTLMLVHRSCVPGPNSSRHHVLYMSIMGCGSAADDAVVQAFRIALRRIRNGDLY